MGKGNSKILMALGVVLALIAGGITFVVAQTAAPAANAQVPQKEVVVVRPGVEVPERAVITEGMVEMVKMPESLIPGGAVLKLQDAVGKYAISRLYPQTVVLDKEIQTPKPGDTPPATQPPATTQAAVPATPPQIVPASFTLEKGKTMVAVDYPEAAKLITAGLLRAGDKVDIYVRAPGSAGDQFALVFSNMEIKALGNLTAASTTSATGSNTPAPTPTMIFVVSPQDALVLKFIESMNPFLLIRSVDDGDAPRQTDPVTSSYIENRFLIRQGIRLATPQR